MSSLTDDVEKEAEAKDQEKRRETENEEKKGGERKREVIKKKTTRRGLGEVFLSLTTRELSCLPPDSNS